MDLPMVIMVEILSKFPIKFIFRCRTVCKLWYHLLTSDPLFLNFPCILLCDCLSNFSLLEIKANYVCYSHRRNRPIVFSPLVESPMFLIGSCNGFICLLNGETCDENHSVYINNPLLCEYFKLKLPKWEKSACKVGYGFCFSEASGQYKVLRLLAIKGSRKVSELEVYTLGIDEKWRNVGQVPRPVWYKFGNVNVNGALHWMDREKNDSIYSFDIGTEKLKSLAAPPGLETPSSRLRLVELGNCLCLTEFIYKQRLDIWWMKEYGIAKSWTKKDSILVDSILPGIVNHILEPILIWKDGEILIRSGTKLASYNPIKKKFRKVNVYGNITATTRYIPSFYSLKTVMGENFQVSYVYSKPRTI